jgi:hypothetical protein
MRLAEKFDWEGLKTLSKYVTIIGFPLQQLLHEHA